MSDNPLPVSIGLIGGAKMGKSTISEYIVAQGEHVRHALAAPMKALLGMDDHAIAAAEAGTGPRPVLKYAHSQASASVWRIVAGTMGYESGGFSPVLYAQDMAIRAYFERQIDLEKDAFRIALQQIGTEIGRRGGREPWLATMLRESASSRRHGALATVCNDVRMPHESKALRERGFKFIRVIRPGGEDKVAAGHSSEAFWRTLPADYEIVNDGSLAGLYQAVDIVLEDFRGVTP